MKTGGIHWVPVIMQMESSECGAASLAMILAYYGLWLPLSQVRYECGVSRDGSNLKNIASVAREHGLETKAFKANPDELKDLPLPCIAHWDFNHFVVITGVNRKNVFINNPGNGPVKMSLDETGIHMTGIVLTMQPGPDFKTGGKKPNIARFVRERLRSAKPAFRFTFLTGLILALTGILTPIVTQLFMDDILPHKNPDWFAPFLALYGILVMVQVITRIIIDSGNRAYQMQLSIENSSSFLWHILRLPIRFFEQHSPGDLISRQTNAGQLTSTLVGKLAPLFTNSCLLVVYLLLMLRYNLLLAGVAALITLLNLLLAAIMSKKQVNLIRVAERNKGRLNETTMSSFSNIEAVKAAGAEEEFFERWSAEYAASYNADVKMNTAMAYIDILPTILITLGNTLILALGVYSILQGNLTIGMLMAIQALISSFMSISENISGTIKDLLTMRADMERMDDVYLSETDPVLKTDVRVGKSDDEKLHGALELKNVSFGYNRLSPPIIEDFSLKLEPGKSVALVGGTGSGKSTIAKLIAGIHQPWSGEILYDGLPANKFSREKFVNSVALIDQDHVSFKGTISDNIKMWDGTIEDFAMIMACYQARIHYEIAQRPEAYETEMAEGGTNFSGGQCQRMEIATALVREPVILLMDEATSALDAITEAQVMNAIKDMGITLVIVAHRLSTIRDCDEIIVLDRGHVSERGTHAELMSRDGLYNKLMTIDGGNG